MATTGKPTKAQLEAAAKKAKAAAAKKVTAPVAPAATAHAGEAVAPAATAAAQGINLQHLTHIVSATNVEPNFCYSPGEVSAPLVAAGLVQVMPAVVDENGHMATRATEAGVAYVMNAASPFGAAAVVQTPFQAFTQAAGGGVPNSAPATGTPGTPAPRTLTKAPEGGFTIAVGITPPPLQRSFGERKALYPFAELPVGGSFFVAATAARPKPSKSMASTVNSAVARFTVADGVDAAGKPKFKKERQFALRAVAADHDWGNGQFGGAPWGQPGVAGAMVSRTV